MKGKTMSETPRTDAFCTKKVWVEWTHKSLTPGDGWEGVKDGGYVYEPRDDLTIEEVLEHARQLERDLAAAQARVERLRKADHEAFVLTAALCALPDDKDEKISRSRVMDLVVTWRRKHTAALAEDRHEQ